MHFSDIDFCLILFGKTSQLTVLTELDEKI